MPRSTLLLALFLAFPAASSFAQTPPEKPPEKQVEKPQDKNAMNKSAVEALQAGKLDEGIAILMKALDAYPKDADFAYNLACAWTRKGDVEKGFEWLGKSVDWGWGKGSSTLVGETTTKSHLEMTKADPDFANLRKDPRWEPLLDRIAKANPAKPAGAPKAVSYIPEKVKAANPVPLLIVLHDEGSSNDKVVAGRWKAIADELGYALLAPSGTVPVGGDPSKGMGWYAKLEDYPAQAATTEKTVTDAVAAFVREHPIDKSKTVIVGEGAGALVAMGVGLTGQGLCKGIVTVNGKFNPDLYATKAPAAGKAGVRVELLIDGAKTAKEAAPEGGADKVAASQTKLLQTWGIAGEARVFTPSEKDPDQKGLLVEAVRSVVSPMPAPAPTPAAAPK